MSRVPGAGRAKIRMQDRSVGREEGCFPFEVRDVGLVEGRRSRKLSAIERSLVLHGGSRRGGKKSLPHSTH